MSDERRAEIEAVKTAIVDEVQDHLEFNVAAYGKAWTGEYEDTRFVVGKAAEKAIAALDRLRDARGDDEGYQPCSPECPNAGNIDCALCARSLQSKGYEAAHRAGIEAAMRAFDDAAMGGFDSLRDEDWPEHAMRQAIAAYISRCPLRDGTVAVEDVAAWLLDDEMRRDFLAEFSPASTGDREDNDG